MSRSLLTRVKYLYKSFTPRAAFSPWSRHFLIGVFSRAIGCQGKRRQAGDKGDEGDEGGFRLSSSVRVTRVCHVCSGSTLFFAPSPHKSGQWTTMPREAACGRTFLHVEE